MGGSFVVVVRDLGFEAVRLSGHLDDCSVSGGSSAVKVVVDGEAVLWLREGSILVFDEGLLVTTGLAYALSSSV